MVCLEVLPGTWEPDPFLDVFFFLVGNKSSLPSLRAVGGLRLEVLPGTWEPDLFLDVFFFWSEITSCSASQKVDTELGQAPTSQAITRDRPPTALNLAVRTQLSGAYALQVWW